MEDTSHAVTKLPSPNLVDVVVEVEPVTTTPVLTAAGTSDSNEKNNNSTSSNEWLANYNAEWDKIAAKDSVLQQRNIQLQMVGLLLAVAVGLLFTQLPSLVDGVIFDRQDNKFKIYYFLFWIAALLMGVDIWVRSVEAVTYFRWEVTVFQNLRYFILIGAFSFVSNIIVIKNPVLWSSSVTIITLIAAGIYKSDLKMEVYTHSFGDEVRDKVVKNQNFQFYCMLGSTVILTIISLLVAYVNLEVFGVIAGISAIVIVGFDLWLFECYERLISIYKKNLAGIENSIWPWRRPKESIPKIKNPDRTKKNQTS